MQFFKDRRIWGVLAAGAVLGGCNLGMAPTGGSPAEIEANFRKQSPQDQIRVIQASPASPDRKAQLIHDIETKYGIKSGDAGAAPAAGAPPEHH